MDASQRRPDQLGTVRPVEHWTAVFSVAVACFALVTTEFLPVGLLSAIARDLHVGIGTAGLMIGTPGCVAAASAPLLALAIRTADRRFVLLGMMTCLLISDVMSALTTSFPVMLLARTLFGVAVGGFWAIGVTVGARLVREAHVARATSVIFSGISLGTLLGVPAGTLLGSLAGWRSAFAVAAVLSLLILVVQVLVLPRLPSERAVRLSDFREIARTRSAAAGLLMVMLAVAGQFAAYTFINPILSDVTRLSSTAFAQALLAYGVAGIFGNALAGIGAARNLRVALLVGLFSQAAAIMAFGLSAASLVIALLSLVVWGVAWGALPLLQQSWALKASPGMTEGGAALFVSVFQGSIALGAAFGGIAVERLRLTSGTTLGGLLVLFGFAVIFFTTQQLNKDIRS